MPDRRRATQAPRKSRSRAVNRVAVLERFLIICEGKNTEPLYFESFKVPGRVLQIIGTGMNTLSLVDEGIRLRSEEEKKLKRQGMTAPIFDQCWCVFDRDSFPSGTFNSAISKAEAHGFQVAYSNEAFELWYLLHFGFHHSATTRGDYNTRLTTVLKRQYVKTAANSLCMYELLFSRQETAIRNARRLLAFHGAINPELNNPSTTVHLLVEELKKATIPLQTHAIVIPDVESSTEDNDTV